MSASWLPMVRAAIPRCAEPFSASDLCRAMGVDPHDNTRAAVADVLERLEQGHELAKETLARGTKRTKIAYRRTSSFRAGEYDFHAQRRAAACLQELAIRWGNRRIESQHAQAD